MTESHNDKFHVGVLRPEASDLLERGGLYGFLNPLSCFLLMQCQDPSVRRAIGGARWYVDGMLLAVLLKIVWGVRVERVSFDNSSLALEIFGAAQKRGSVVSVIGGKPGAAAVAAKRLNEVWPNLKVIAEEEGFATEEALSECAKRISDEEDRLVIVGMGSPRQEWFLGKLAEAGFRGTAMTCGAFIEQINRGVEYYPDWAVRWGLRFLWRIWQEPRKMLWRYLLVYPRALAGIAAGRDRLVRT